LDWNGHWLVAFRYRDRDAMSSTHAALLQGDIAGGPSRRVNLSEHAASFGVSALADPKLFRLGAEAWITFNDGYSELENHVYLMRVAPELGRPLLCQLQDRQRIEKNWAFMLDGDGDRLKALYSVEPVCFISTHWPPAESSGALQFTHDASVPSDARAPKRNGRTLSIGTQLSHDGANTWLVTHEKWYFGGKRLYLGRATTLNSKRAALSYSSRRLSHSLASLVGARHKTNPKLISCTYFSGMVVRQGHAILGYGINDVGFNFAEIPVRLI
jgi:hypothetical protein